MQPAVYRASLRRGEEEGKRERKGGGQKENEIRITYSWGLVSLDCDGIIDI